jgi:uncharacterized membrane protein
MFPFAEWNKVVKLEMKIMNMKEEVQVSFSLKNLSTSQINKAKKTETQSFNNFFVLIEVEVGIKIITSFKDIKVSLSRC